MSPTTATKMKAEEFFDFVQRPENENRSFELDRGEVIEMPSPTKPHCLVTANAARILGNYSFQVGTCYILSNDAGVILTSCVAPMSRFTTTPRLKKNFTPNTAR